MKEYKVGDIVVMKLNHNVYYKISSVDIKIIPNRYYVVNGDYFFVKNILDKHYYVQEDPNDILKKLL